MLKYVSKFAMDILPSVVATIIGAYIVNHYVVTKPGVDAPVAAAVSMANPKAAKAAETSTDVANLPQPGVRAKGISEKAIIERSAVEKPIEKSPEKAQEKSADTLAETAALPADPRRHPPVPREKAIAKATPAPVQPSAPAVVPVVAAPVEAAITPEEQHRDANDLARAAIERLRGSSDGAPRSQEAARTPDAPAVAPRVADVPRVVPAPTIVVAVPPIRPLPPPIMVSTPAGETIDSTGSLQLRQPYPAPLADPNRPTPPADIPVSQPLDLHAEASEPAPRNHKTVAEDMMLAAKSMFHAVLPNNSAN
jgi:hypothetical protein